MRGWERFSWSDEAKGYNGNISSNFKNRHTISNHFINRTLEWIQPLIIQKIPLKSSHWVEHEVHKINYRSHFLVLIRILYGEYFSQSCDHFRSLHALSAFLLSAEVQSVKDLADSLLSQENIDAISTIASDALTLAKSTIETAQNNINVNVVTDVFTSSQIGSKFEGFLNANPDLKLSTSKYIESVWWNQRYNWVHNNFYHLSI